MPRFQNAAGVRFLFRMPQWTTMIFFALQLPEMTLSILYRMNVTHSV